jgi:hypothetical protein
LFWLLKNVQVNVYFFYEDMTMKYQLKTGVIAIGFVTCFGGFNAFAANNGGDMSEASVPIGSLKANGGDVVCTAAVNNDGTLASSRSGSFVQSSTRLGLGQYQVLFNTPCGNVTAANGFARFVQVDTLTIGTTDGSCQTANRSGAINGVWINCSNSAGIPADRSFFLFVTR